MIGTEENYSYLVKIYYKLCMSNIWTRYYDIRVGEWTFV